METSSLVCSLASKCLENLAFIMGKYFMAILEEKSSMSVIIWKSYIPNGSNICPKPSAVIKYMQKKIKLCVFTQPILTLTGI